MNKFKVGDLVRLRLGFRGERPHLGIVVEDLDELRLWRYKVQWFTDNNSISSHSPAALVKAKVRGV